jgi:hypothetical protein
MIRVYDVMKTTISKGGYRLEEVLNRVKRLFLLGDLTEAEFDELLELAVQGASADAERPELDALIQVIAESLTAIEARVTALEAGNSGGEDNSGGAEQPEYPEWKPWDGISKDYLYGAIVSHNGELWISVFSGQNVWEPGVVGTESIWQRYIVEEEPIEPDEGATEVLS